MSFMKPLRPPVIALALLLGISGPAAAMFHIHLDKSAPAKNQELTEPPKEVRLWFSEKPEVRLSTITLQGADSAKVVLSKPSPTDDAHSVVSKVTGAMGPGTYLVKWKTAGKDGHAIRGSYTFSIAK